MLSRKGVLHSVLPALEVHLVDNKIKTDPANRQFISKIEMSNGTGRTLLVVDRDGVRVTLFANNRLGNHSNKLTIEKEVDWRFNTAKVDTTSLSESATNDKRVSDYRKVVNDFWASGVTNRNGSSIYNTDWCSTDRMVLSLDAELLEKEGGVVYLPMLDILVGFEEKVNSGVLHPYSDIAIKRREELAISKSSEKDAFVLNKITFVDNTGLEPPRFVNINGVVHQLDPTVNEIKADGIYICSNYPYARGVDTSAFAIRYYTLMEATKANIVYASPSEAETMGNINSLKQREADQIKEEAKAKEQAADMEILRLKQQLEADSIEAKLEIEEAKVEASRVKAKFESDLLALSLEKSRRESEYEKQIHDLKLEKARLDSLYEQRSHNRKDSSEFLKWGSAAVIAGASIAAAIIKFTAKASLFALLL